MLTLSFNDRLFDEARGAQHKKLLLVYALYRIALALLLLASAHFSNAATFKFFILNIPFVYILWLFVGITCLDFTLIYKRFSKQPFAYTNIHSLYMCITDTILLWSLMYGNGQPDLQIAMLILVEVIAANLLMSSQLPLLLALTTVIYLVYFNLLQGLHSIRVDTLMPSLLLALTVFIMAWLGRGIATRLRQYEHMELETHIKIETLRQLNQSIIEEMNHGIMVLTQQLSIVFLNQAAKQLLKIKYLTENTSLQSISAPLFQKVSEMQDNRQTRGFLLPNQDLSFQIGLSLTLIRTTRILEQPLLLVYVEDADKANQQAQELKLQSLGRLTAGIAHEIRNPLSAILQSSEFLAENPLSENDAALLRIIQNQSKRINHIVEDVLSLSKQKNIDTQKIHLKSWLIQTIHSLLPDIEPIVQLHLNASIEVEFDPNHLEYIMLNLLHNAAHHAKKSHRPVNISIYASEDEQGIVFMDIIDSGTGIPTQQVPLLFEPFYTTEKNGTGLGLYLSRTYAETNGANLFYLPNKSGTCFRLEFTNSSAHAVKETPSAPLNPIDPIWQENP